MDNEKLQSDIHMARLVILGQLLEIHDMEDLANRLRDAGQYNFAGEIYRILLKVKHQPEKHKVWTENLAYCLYKDPDLPSSIRYDEALRQLRRVFNLEKSSDPEVLGMAGAIHKRKWQFDNKFENLVLAEHYYGRGHYAGKEHRSKKERFNNAFEVWESAKTSSPEKRKARELLETIRFNDEDGLDDAGYTGINFAFILDQLAVNRLKVMTEIKDPNISESAISRIKKAQTVRREIIQNLLGEFFNGMPDNLNELIENNTFKKDRRWVFATLGECYFGLGMYELAVKYYAKYREVMNNDWKINTSTEQVMRLAEIQDQLGSCFDSETCQTLKIPFFEKQKVLEAARGCLLALHPKRFNPDDADLSVYFRGKVGLALSGGGFRAALFHVGVLARLAELDVLRHVEVLSCVSGGSIAGTYYYMLLQREIEKHGDKLEQSNYISIVREMEQHFLRGVQKNLRVRVFTNVWKNFKILMGKGYSRTNRMGELYEEFLYKKILRHERKRTLPVFMHELKIEPADWSNSENFNPKYHNWQRKNKVPMLVLNATTLNTGHNWQFTASWMGEPPGNIKQDIDAKQRLRRMYYKDAPPEYKNNIRIGQAVGASSCVPALFEPILFKDLYPGINVQLVDGGVHDNQGIVSLLEQECKVMIVSDASGQLDDSAQASENLAGVFFRSDLVLQERIRESQFLDLKAREEASQLNGLAIVHLKKDLQKNPVNWKSCEEPPRSISFSDKPQRNPDLTSYGVRRDVQKALAAVRTDLDAFSDAEAFALMYSGYAQTSQELANPKFSFFKKETAQQTWEFLHIEKRMQHPFPSEGLLKRLRVGASVPLKIFKINWLWTGIGYAIGLALLGALLFTLYHFFWNAEWKATGKSLGMKIGLFIVLYLVATYINTFVEKALNWKNTLLRIGLVAVGAVILSVFSWVYIWFFNPFYVRWGRLANLDDEDWLRKKLQKLWSLIS